MRKIGLHLRLTTSLSDLIDTALRLNLDFFQCFLIEQASGKVPSLDKDDIAYFRTMRDKHFGDTYLHGSYWINLAGIGFTRHYALERELALAHDLAFTHMVLHPGSAKGASSTYEGIDAIARVINSLMRTSPRVKIVLENMAFGGVTVGGDIRDFHVLLTKLEQPDKLLFCIDTAHAHAYGYDLISAVGRNAFVQELDDAIGIDRIALLHLNDTKDARGSQHDCHALLGVGTLGDQVLQEFALHPRLKHIPLLMELPIVSEEQERAVLDTVRSWHVAQGE